MNKYMYVFIGIFVLAAAVIAQGSIINAPMAVRLVVMLALFGGCAASLGLYIRSRGANDDDQ